MIICFRWFQHLTIFMVCFLFSCAPSINQFYPDFYYDEDDIYQNKPLGFLLTFIGNWNIITDPNDMDRANRNHARNLKKSGVELLFIGENVEGFIGTRGVAVNLNIPAREYAEYVRMINREDIQSDSGLVDVYVNKYPAVKWVYEKEGFKFAEYFFGSTTYDIRIAFWTEDNLFENLVSVFEQIMGTLTLT